MIATPQNPMLAAVFILTATACIAASTLLAKALGTGALGQIDLGGTLPVFQITFGRFLFALLAIGSIAAMTRLRLTQVHWRLHVARTACGFTGVTLMFAAVAFIPLADATAISFLNPVFCMLFAIPLLGERVGPWRWAAAVIALIGAAILLRPTGASFQPLALLALGAAVIMGVELIAIKHLTGREKPLQILFINNVIGTMIAALAAMTVWVQPNAAQWLVLAGVGLFMAAAQACFVNGMARGDASFVAPFSYATLIFATVYDALIFNVRPDLVSGIGASVILAGAALLAWREGKARPAPALQKKDA